MNGEHGLGLADATEALAELSDLDALAEQLGQDYPGASLDDIDEDLVRRALGRPAVDDLQRLRTTERELERQGYLDRTDGRLELSPKAVRRLGLTALRRVFSSMQAPGRGDHDVQDAGATGELTGSSRQWTYGDEQPLDVVRTIANAVRHRAPHEPIRLRPDDFEVRESERRSRAAVCLLVDMSYSMVINGTWGAAKSTALALQALMTSSYPQDALQIIGFSDYARVLQPTELAGLDSAMVQGTNVQHALMLAGRFIGRHHDAEPVVMLVTDGEPTAHLLRDGTSWFSWPPERETLSLTMAEVDKLARRQATVNVFVLGDDPRLREFVDDLAKRAGGRVFATDADNLGAYLVTDFAARRARILRGRRKAG
jgi:uncharacterized protein with von Willebrand factor type A (vWA) domain